MARGRREVWRASEAPPTPSSYAAERLEQRLLLATITWNPDPRNPFWYVATNWDLGKIPSQVDDVILPPNKPTCVISGSNRGTTVHSITTYSLLEVDDNFFNAPQGAHFNDNLILKNATLGPSYYNFALGTPELILTGGTGTNTISDATVIGNIVVTGSASTDLNGAVITGNLDVTRVTSHVTVENGLSIQGTMSLGSADGSTYATLDFLGGSPQTVDAPVAETGSIVFGSSLYNSFNNMMSGLPVTLGSRIAVDGSSATIGGALGGGGPFINLGTVAADVSGGMITVTEQFANQGTISAANGGTLILQNSTGNLGQVTTLARSSTLTVSGMYTINVPIGLSDNSTLNLNGNWSSTSTISINTATLNLGGTFTTGGLGNISRPFASAPAAGTINLIGVLDNTSSTLAFNLASGSWNMAGGTIKNGTITESGGFGLVFTTNSDNLLDGVTFLGTLDLSQTSGAFIAVQHGLTLNGTIRIGSADGLNSGRLDFTGATPQTLQAPAGGAANVLFGPSYYNSLDNFTQYFATTTRGQAVTFGPGVLIHGAIASLGGTDFPGSQFTNLGTIAADAGGSSFTVSEALSNQGALAVVAGGAMTLQNVLANLGNATIQNAGSNLSVSGTNYTINQGLAANRGTTVSLNGSWSNAAGSTISADTSVLNLGSPGAAWSNLGAISSNQATVNLGGTFTVASLGAFNRTGGTVNLVGTLTNTAAALALNASSGSWIMAGGTIIGGAITETEGALLLPATGNNVLDGLTIQGSLDLSQTSGASVQIKDGLTINGTILIGSADASMYGRLDFIGNAAQTLAATAGGAAVVLLGGSAANSFNDQMIGQPVTLAPSVQVHGKNGSIGGYAYGGSQFINQGSIAADTSAGTLIITEPLTNQGTAQADGGTLNLRNVTNLAGGMLTGGTWKALAGSKLLLPAPITINAGNIVLDGAGSALMTGPANALANQYQNAPGGALTLTNGQTLVITPGGGTLTNDGTLNLGPGATLSLSGAFTQPVDGTISDSLGGPPTGGYGQLAATGALNLDGALQVNWPAGLDPAPGATYTLLSGASRTGTFAAFITVPSSIGGLLQSQYSPTSAYITVGGSTQYVIAGTAGNDSITIVRDPDGQHLDWTMGPSHGQLPIMDPNGLTISGNGGADTITLDYSKGDPLHTMLHLIGTFTLNGLPSAGDPLAGHAIDIGRGVLFISYTASSDPIALIRTYLKNGYANGAWTGASDCIITSAGTSDCGIGYVDSADGAGINPASNTIELKYSFSATRTSTAR